MGLSWRWKTGRWRAFRNFPVSWLHQRWLYMDKSERIFHIALNALAALLFYGFFTLSGLFEIWTHRLIAALVSARTLSWFLNDHFWGLLLVSLPFVKNPGIMRFCKYLEYSRDRAFSCKSLSAYALYGGLTRGKFHPKSDIDVRYIRKPGFWNAISCLSFAARERAIALFSKIALDLYVGDSIRFLDKMSKDEIPVPLKDDEGLLSSRFGNKAEPFEKMIARIQHDFGEY
jgi:hypothetical protein